MLVGEYMDQLGQTDTIKQFVLDFLQHYLRLRQLAIKISLFHRYLLLEVAINQGKQLSKSKQLLQLLLFQVIRIVLFI